MEAFPEVREDGLQLDEDRRLQDRIWTVERVVHLLLGVGVVIGMLGLLGGGGPFSTAMVTGDGGSVEYPRVGRLDTTGDVSIHFNSARTDHRLRLRGPFQRFQIESVEPQPLRQIAGSDGVTFEFAADGAGPATVAVRLRATRAGVSRLSIALDGSEPLAATVIVLP